MHGIYSETWTHTMGRQFTASVRIKTAMIGKEWVWPEEGTADQGFMFWKTSVVLGTNDLCSQPSVHRKDTK